MALPEEAAVRELLAGFERLLRSGEFSDLSIDSSDRTYAVHKAVICPQSTFFWSACTRDFKERGNNRIELRDDEPDAVHCMIQYFYTLAYPAELEPTESTSPTGDSEHFRSGVLVDDHVSTDAHDSEGDPPPAVTGDTVAIEISGMSNDGDLAGNIDKSSETICDQTIVQSEASQTSATIQLYQDLRVYAIGEKYGIPLLKKKAEEHFQQELAQIEMTVDIFEVIREVYSTTPSNDRVLREIVIARVYGEVQHWVNEKTFMEALSCEGDFCADLLSYTVKEDLKQYEAALANIQHPGYCSTCQATMIVKRSTSRKGNVRIDKYCAKCDPWH